MKTEIQSRSDITAEAEKQLIQACTQNHPAWEDQLISWLSGNGAWLQRHCVALLGNSTDAEDAVQEITLKVIRAISRFEGRSSLRTWVSRIADNHCFTLIKKKSSRTLNEHLRHCLTLAEEDRHTEAAPDANEDSTGQVHSTLDRLTSTNREILELRYFEELSIKQMATALNLTQSATKMRLYRAMDVFKINFQNVAA
ncbi:RNA polymerase sigma factor [Granulosicoccus antarcticus]|uniref:ECF RNA polymerase sigma factor SigG n=1 Tax=Granulosicoccus antarcticus IMCC3135 TaxID=1192854 RepID=A0A2Z2P2M3_9GAMM|nr:RNA polymerase sigma factor [Granulosicoccus antarcticus]ASJ76578.1 ECF RNA polymerase sigma factor SigG [Granulosicoccus antarcticus IMCC3135]